MFLNFTIGPKDINLTQICALAQKAWHWNVFQIGTFKVLKKMQISPILKKCMSNALSCSTIKKLF